MTKFELELESCPTYEAVEKFGQLLEAELQVLAYSSGVVESQTRKRL